MTQNLSVVIVEKLGSLKSLVIKDYKEDDLYKKCGFKKSDGFIKQTEWGIKMDGKKMIVSVYAKSTGKANSENKYDFPPPIDTTIFFGNCLLICSIKQDNNNLVLTSLSIEQWEKIYEKLFGGFEDLNATSMEDENEEDELDNIPESKKTKQGYLKDGFVVDYESIDDNFSDTNDNESEDNDNEGLEVEDIGSELSEEEYESSSDGEK